MKILDFFSIFVGHFCPPGSGSGSIRSGSETLVAHSLTSGGSCGPSTSAMRTSRRGIAHWAATPASSSRQWACSSTTWAAAMRESANSFPRTCGREFSWPKGLKEHKANKSLLVFLDYPLTLEEDTGTIVFL